MSDRDLEGLMEFLHQAEELKYTFRFGAHEPLAGKESSAAHSWRLAILAIIVANKFELNIDVKKATEIALIHDLPEAVTGDYDRVDVVEENGITEDEKRNLEAEAIDKLGSMLDGFTGDMITERWYEYEEKESREAKFIKALDKIETMIHLVWEGHKKYDEPDLAATYADEAVGDFPQLKPLLRKVKEELKEEYERGGIEWKGEYEGL